LHLSGNVGKVLFIGIIVRAGLSCIFAIGWRYRFIELVGIWPKWGLTGWPSHRSVSFITERLQIVFF